MNTLSSLLRLIYSFTLLSFCGTSGHTYCVSPNGEHVSYQGESCRSLNTYALNSSIYFQSDTIFYFLNGTNILDLDVTVSITSATNISLIGLTFGCNESISTIECSALSCLSITSVSYLIIVNLTITNLGTQPDVSAMKLAYVSGTILIDGINVLNISGYGVQVSNSDGSVIMINRSTFADINGTALNVVNALASISNSLFVNSSTGIMALNTGLYVEQCNFTSCMTACVNATSDGVNPFTIEVVLCSFTFSTTGLSVNSSYNVALDQAFFNSVKTAVLIKNCNSYIKQSLFENSTNAGIYIYSYAEISDSNFTVALGSIIYAIQSEISLSGSIRFTGGYSTGYGGAFYLSGSNIYLIAPANVSFINNTAELGGGAIYNEYHHSQGDCFFQLSDYYGSLENPGIQLHFEGNHAANAGGGDVYSSLQCNLYRYYIPNYLTTSTTMDIFEAITIKAPVGAQVELAADPFAVCVVNVSPNTLAQCSHNQTDPYTVAIFPGQSMTISLSTLDEFNKTTPSLVYFINMADNTIIDVIRTTANDKEPEIFDVVSSLGNITIQLVTQTVITSGLSLYDQYVVRLSVTVLPCPPGFLLSRATNTCECNTFLQGQSVSCDIVNINLVKPLYSWLGYTSSGHLAVSNPCPPGYCKELRDVNLIHADEQCDYNHAGVLCGGCATNFSTVFGTTFCQLCTDNRNISLFIPFAIMGVALVAFLVVFNLTVTNGILNGFLFYANVIKIFDSTFLPLQTSDTFVYVFSIFISWLNLDLGIVTCFYKGMDAYSKMWLQYVFPIYTLILVGGIAIAGKFSKRISRIFSRRIVPLVATLLLMTYTKLLKVSIAILSFSEIKIENNNETISDIVWRPDGNIEYLGGGHAALFSVAIVVLIAFVIPYTFLLLLTPCIESKSSWQTLCCTNKLKPLIDCYEGPYVTRHHFWTGILLLSRAIIYITNEIVYFMAPDATSLVVFLTAFGLAIYLTRFGVYKKWQYTLLEMFLCLNMAALGLFLLLLEDITTFPSSDSAVFLYPLYTLYSIAVGSVFMSFVVVMGLQIYHIIREIYASKKHVTVKEKYIDSSQVANTYVVLDVSHGISEDEELNSISSRLVHYTQ